jgi:hypothetical protein
MVLIHQLKNMNIKQLQNITINRLNFTGLTNKLKFSILYYNQYHEEKSKNI